MNQTQRPLVTHKAILHAIWKQLLTLEKSLSYWTIPVLPPPMNPQIDQGNVPIILASHTFMMPVTKSSHRGRGVRRHVD